MWVLISQNELYLNLYRSLNLMIEWETLIFLQRTHHSLRCDLPNVMCLNECDREARAH